MSTSISTSRLIALLKTKTGELESMSTRLKEKPRTDFNQNIVRARLDAIYRIWEEARDIHADIIAREDAMVDEYISSGNFSRFQIVYEEVSDFLMTLLSEIEIANETTLPARRSIASSSDAGDLTANLPKLNLPKFSGEYNDWENFRDLFTTLVHNHSRLSNATKLQYLKTCLSGTAADLVKDVSTTDANYDSTWQALNDRFHNPRLIVNNHLQKLMEIPYLKKESAVDLQSFTDEALRIYRALKNLKMPVEHWDVWFVFILAARLDPDSRKAWETELSQKDVSASLDAQFPERSVNRFPTFEDLSQFLEKRTRTLGMIASDGGSTSRAAGSSKPAPGSKRTYHAAFGGKKTSKCPVCSGDHPIKICPKFNALTPFERREEARRVRLCFNCLGKHKFSDCKSQGRCSTCQGKHHSMIHYNSPTGNSSQKSTSGGKGPADGKGGGSVNVHTSKISFPRQVTVILATAQFTIIGPCGNQTRVRALLDQGAESCFISDKIASLINLPKTPVRVPLTGLGAQDVGVARFSTSFTLQSLVNPSYRLDTHALILPKLTAQIPSRQPLDLNLESLSDLRLADPEFHVPDSIDVILGADVYGQLLLNGLRRLPSSSLIAQKTALGWIVSGSVASRRAEDGSQSPVTGFHCAVQADLNESLQRLRDLEALSWQTKEMSTSPMNILHCATETDLNESLQRFWDLEEVPSPKNPLNPDDSACEELFVNSHSRDSTGRFIVRLPFRSSPPAAAAETRRMALGSLSHMHRRFARDSRLAEGYRDFMATYEKLGHMERVPVADIHNSQAWYLPHHAVVQSCPLKWKLRVVFDASRRIQEKVCLNDFLLSGPSLQKDLALILLNWRVYRFVFTADIVKMFRQMRVHSSDQNWQRIVWSPDPQSPPVDYRLTTVTYGTNCAPYLAIRTLLQLAQDEESRFPLGARCLVSNTYVDDIFTGADDLDSAIKVRQDLIQLLNSAGISLDKWSANHLDLLPNRASNTDESKPIALDASVKTLGIQWNPLRDQFGFTTLDLRSLISASTKRAVLSTISKLFDPLGWLAPITVTAKILMQDLWIVKCGWDDPLPPDIRDRWHEYCRALTALPSMSISRWFGTRPHSSLQLQGFCDASSRAYAAAVYLRVEDDDNQVQVMLLAAKSKVAPVKTVSIPNLELCGAVLLVKLIRYLQKSEFLQKVPIFAWSDSQIVLKYLQKHPCHWKTFVANRVSFIQTELPAAVWAHVPTKENPADLATRGSTPMVLSESRLWQYGPDWLSMSSDHWPQSSTTSQVLHTRAEKSVELSFFSRFSSLERLTRVVARLLRPMTVRARRKQDLDPLPDFITAPELRDAQVAIIRSVQAVSFRREIGLLKEGKRLPKLNPLLKLNPFFDKRDGLLRVGGRLAHSELSYQRKHPAILPKSSTVSRLFVRRAHEACLHGGPTLTASALNQRVWVLGRNRLVKTEIRTCVPCQRANPRLAHQMMGDLPAERTIPARPFSTTGLDYAGPFQIKVLKGRGQKSFKGYIALFVCFSTRAIHLELVEDLQSNSFIAAFQRFVGRRGVCQNLFSDNATTFDGADRDLRDMFSKASNFYKEVAPELANDGTHWNFIPPNSPHYGGLWEAGVKSVKHHLKRVVGDRSFNFAEMSTLLIQIEACLNSRPLSPLSSDVEDIHALTPFHFLTGGASGLIPDEEPPDVPENRLDRFHLIQRIRNQFWKRWSSEYLQHLQERAKWRSPEDNFAVGRLVIMRDDQYPPSKWPLGRVIEVHPGSDGLVRVVTVRTATSTFKRHIVRLCPLLLDTDFPRKSP